MRRRVNREGGENPPNGGSNVTPYVPGSKVRVSFSYTVNMGNYESAKLESSVDRELAPGEDLDSAMDTEFARCREFVEAKVLEVEEDHGRERRR